MPVHKRRMFPESPKNVISQSSLSSRFTIDAILGRSCSTEENQQPSKLNIYSTDEHCQGYEGDEWGRTSLSPNTSGSPSPLNRMSSINGNIMSITCFNPSIQHNEMQKQGATWVHHTPRGHISSESRKPVQSTSSKSLIGRSPRVPFTRMQVEGLETKFRVSNYLSSREVTHLAIHLNVTETRVKIWFQNRRARQRRETFLGEILHNPQQFSTSISQEYPSNTSFTTSSINNLAVRPLPFDLSEIVSSNELLLQQEQQIHQSTQPFQQAPHRDSFLANIQGNSLRDFASFYQRQMQRNWL